jgi:hypothetical protein
MYEKEYSIEKMRKPKQRPIVGGDFSQVRKSRITAHLNGGGELGRSRSARQECGNRQG